MKTLTMLCLLSSLSFGQHKIRLQITVDSVTLERAAEIEKIIQNRFPIGTKLMVSEMPEQPKPNPSFYFTVDTIGTFHPRWLFSDSVVVK